MTQKKRRPTDNDRDVRTNVPHVDDFDTDPADDGLWSEEELERASMGWRAEDEQKEQHVPSNAPHVGDLDADAEDLEDALEQATDALTDMTSRAIRRDQVLRSSGKDYSAGFESHINTNSPKEDDLASKKARRQSRPK